MPRAAPATRTSAQDWAKVRGRVWRTPKAARRRARDFGAVQYYGYAGDRGHLNPDQKLVDVTARNDGVVLPVERGCC